MKKLVPFECLKKLSWIVSRIINLFLAVIRVIFYVFIHPKKVGQLCFTLFSTFNEFYQFSHGRLKNFDSTQTAQKLAQSRIFAESNYFNLDLRVSRPQETLVMASLTKYFSPEKIFEIGTYNGFSTLHFAFNSPPTATIYTLDLPPEFNILANTVHTEISYDDLQVIRLSQENIKKRIYKNHPLESKIIELFGDSRTFDFSPYYGKMDMIFIDGNHSYDYVKSDTENAFKMLSPNGIILWHDFDYIVHKEVFRYLNQLAKEKEICYIPKTRFVLYLSKKF